MKKLTIGGFEYEIENKVPRLNDWYYNSIQQKVFKNTDGEPYDGLNLKVIASNNPKLNKQGVPELTPAENTIRETEWILSENELPRVHENVEISDDGIHVRETSDYKRDRVCMLAGVGGGNGYFGSLGFATDGSTGCESNLILDIPKYWRRYDIPSPNEVKAVEKPFYMEKVCDNCNEPFELNYSIDNSGITILHGNCQYCKHKNDVWIKIRNFRCALPVEPLEACSGDVEIEASKWVFDTNGHRWSNNNNECGDNYESFKMGAQWQASHQSKSLNEAVELLRQVYTKASPENFSKIGAFITKHKLTQSANADLK
ncbi:MAG: hypothetical protein KBC56_04910 [Flavobacterium sp.]|nr:hypothetical protein [Flavobacterium sp.]